MVSTGEQVSISLLAMALKEIGVNAKSMTGGQVAIRTDDSHTKARIQHIDDSQLRKHWITAWCGRCRLSRRGRQRRY